MRRVSVLSVLGLILIAACSDHTRTVWHDQKLPSGSTIKVTSLLLTWGVEHDERHPSQDSFAIEYVSANPQADPTGRDAEAGEVFELIRPISERFGLRFASIAGFPTLQRKGRYDLYRFERQPDGRWSFTRTDAKVFAND